MARGSEVLAVTLPEAGWMPRGSGSTTSAWATRLRPLWDRRVRDGGAHGEGSFRGSQEAEVAVGPPGERERRRDRGRVLPSASQRLRQGGLPGADGISAESGQGVAFALFQDRARVGKSHRTVTRSLDAKQLARPTLRKTALSILFFYPCAYSSRHPTPTPCQIQATQEYTQRLPPSLTCLLSILTTVAAMVNFLKPRSPLVIPEQLPSHSTHSSAPLWGSQGAGHHPFLASALSYGTGSFPWVPLPSAHHHHHFTSPTSVKLKILPILLGSTPRLVPHPTS